MREDVDNIFVSAFVPIKRNRYPVVYSLHCNNAQETAETTFLNIKRILLQVALSRLCIKTRRSVISTVQ